MLVIVETRAQLLQLDAAALQAVRDAGHRIAEVDVFEVDLCADGEICQFSETQIERGMEAARQWLYVHVTDPLFFKAQRGEATLDEWRAAVASIKADWAAPVIGGADEG